MVRVKELVKKLDPYVPGRSNADLARAYNLTRTK